MSLRAVTVERLALVLLLSAALIGIAAIDALAEGPSPATNEQPALDFAAAKAALRQSCGECHAAAKGEGGFSLRRLAKEQSLVGSYELWMRLRHRLADGSMPPDFGEPIPLDERLRLVRWIDGAQRDAFGALGESAGPPMFRRLTAHEYSNSIRDLLAVNFDAGHILPQDIAGGEGFDNASETLTISPIYAEKFLAAATDVLDYASRDAASRALLLPKRPSDQLGEAEAASVDLRTLANRAFRRPVEEAELEPYLALFESARRDRLDFDQAVFYAMRGLLTAPQFLFLIESPPARNAEEPLAPCELASRLSYFLWASMPDEKLSASAAEGRLTDPEELKSQTLRMLGEGTHLEDSLTQFVGQWLGTADLGVSKQLDRKRNPWIQDTHVSAMRSQPVFVFQSVVRENGSLLELIDADWTYLNQELLDAYQLDREKFEKKEFLQNLNRMTLPAEYRYRGGLIGAGGVLAVTSYPHRSSPVLRGVWVLDKMLGVKLPPPPANVPKLDDEHAAVEGETLRQRLQRHREDPACATCHSRMDPLGFALENFSEIGRWRDRDEGGAIDAVAELPGGIRIEGIDGLKRYLLENRDQFVRHLTEKMLGYALARGLRPADQATVEQIVARLKAHDYRAQELVLGIVESKPFRDKRAPP